MFKATNCTPEILKSEKFKKDEISFNIIPAILEKNNDYSNIQCYTDDQNVFMLNTDDKHPIVIWTSEDFTEFDKLYYFLIETFSNYSPLRVMTNKSCFDFFQSKNLILNPTETDTAGIYKCTQLNPLSFKGNLGVAHLDEKEELKNYIQAFFKEVEVNAQASETKFLKIANEFLENPQTHKVWRDESNQIVAIGRIQVVDDKARIGRIYTVPEKRGHSYAKMLVYKLTEIAFQMNLTPVLYTNFNYLPSNKFYQAVGFELLDNVMIYNLNKDK